MTKVELDAIFSRIADGVTDAELERVANFIRETNDPALQHRGLHILGFARAREYAPLIASFLDHTDDINLQAMAIRALVLWFHDAASYTAVLKRFLRGIPQDQDRDLQFATLQVAGEAYEQTADPEILSIIVEFADDGDELLRKAAQESLAAALTPEWRKLSPKQKYDLRRSAASGDYLDQARKRLTGLRVPTLIDTKT